LHKHTGMDNLTMEAPVSFTERAVHEIRRIAQDDNIAEKGQWLRIGVKGGGCSGMTYILGFDQRQEKDELFEVNGVSFVMNGAHGIYLQGMEIDWEDGLNSRGFVFNNPNASKTCGCGSSFAV
jgi:iron-sulfur cluster assembly accessory protein